MAQAQVVLTAVDRTQGAINSAMKGLKGLGDQASFLKRAFAGVGAVAVGQFLTRTAMQAIQYGDEINKAAEKSGLAAESISSLAYAAKKSDVDLGSLSMAIRRMQIALSEAATGGKSQKEAIDALGLSLKQISDLDADKQFELLADRISMLKEPADRAKAASELFGKSWQQLFPLFEKGAGSIRAAREEAEKLGVVLSTDQAKALADADNSIKKLSASWDGFSRTLTAKVAPALSATFDFLSGAWLETETGMTRRLESLLLNQRTISEKLERQQKGGMNVKGRAEYIETLKKQLSDVEKQITDITEKLLPEFKSSSVMAKAPELPGFKDKEINVKISDVSITSVKKSITAMEGFYKSLRDTAFSSFDDQISKFAQIEAALLELRSSGEINAEQFSRGWRVAFNSLAESFNESADKIDPIVLSDKFRSFEELLLSLKTQGQINAEEYQMAWSNAFDAILPGVELTAKKTQEASSQMSEFAKQAAREIQSSFSDFLFDPFENGLKGMLSGFLNIIRRMIAEVAASTILNSIFGSYRGKGGWLGTIADALIPKAAGGPVSPGTPYLVGERGPELFVPGTSGGIMPNNRLGNMGSGVTVAPVYNIDARGASAELQNALPGILAENNRRIFDELDRRYGIGR